MAVIAGSLSFVSNSILLAFLLCWGCFINGIRSSELTNPKSAISRNEILQLTKFNIEHYLSIHRYMFAQVYTPECNVCDSYLPSLNVVAQMVNKTIFNITLAQIDATTDASLLKRYGITLYPSYIYFANKRGVPYKGKFTSKDMAFWLKSRMIKPSLTFLN
jgi:protein disulfide-isomerase A6